MIDSLVFFVPRVRTLERKLEAKMIKEESDYHDLESVVQQVEQNLELMTVQGPGGCVGIVMRWLCPLLCRKPAEVQRPEGPLTVRAEGHLHSVSTSCRVTWCWCLFVSFLSGQKRAMKAENHVMKLKQEISLLQVRGQHGHRVWEPP